MKSFYAGSFRIVGLLEVKQIVLVKETLLYHFDHMYSG